MSPRLQTYKPSKLSGDQIFAMILSITSHGCSSAEMAAALRDKLKLAWPWDTGKLIFTVEVSLGLVCGLM
jgi:hypothetical protein